MKDEKKKRVNIALPRTLYERLFKRKQKTLLPIQAQAVIAITRYLEAEDK